jgi:hypothetical protein
MTLGIYSAAADISMCSVDSASKNEYQDIPGGKGGRCVMVMTLPPSSAECLEIWSLNRPEPSRPHRPVIGIALPFFALRWSVIRAEMCSIIDASNKELRLMAIHLILKYVSLEHRYTW